MFKSNNIIEIDKPCMSEQEFIEFILERDYNENMFNKDGTLDKNYNSSKVTGIISTILEIYSDEFLNKQWWYCIYGHTCKSHLCTSCGYKYKNERVENILETAYACCFYYS